VILPTESDSAQGKRSAHRQKKDRPEAIFNHVSCVSDVEPGLLVAEFLYGFRIVWVWHAAVHGANSRALRLLMETCAFRALVRNNIIDLVGDRSLGGISLHAGAIAKIDATFEVGAV
jgi:hypothetical protein